MGIETFGRDEKPEENDLDIETETEEVPQGDWVAVTDVLGRLHDRLGPPPDFLEQSRAFPEEHEQDESPEE